jgi:hypothetical protein
MSCISCPSNRCKPGSDLIGIRQDDGTVAILPQPLPVDQHFVDIARQTPGEPEERFRFSNKCVESGCGQWTGSRCGVIDRVINMLDAIPGVAPNQVTEETPGADVSLPPCGIRPTCRWFLQSGSNACHVCPYVLTHITEADTIVPLRK